MARNIRLSLNSGHLVGTDSGAVNGSNHEAYFVEVAQNETSLVLRRDYVLDLEDTDSLYVQDVKEANDFGADFAIEYHLNSSVDKSSYGFETFIYSGHKASIDLQRKLHPLTYEIMRKYNVTSKDRGQRQSRDYYFLKGTNMPSIIIEFCFISNDKEMHAFASNAKKIGADMAHAIAKALNLPRKLEINSKYTKEFAQLGEFYITTGRARYLCDKPSLTSKEIGLVPHSTWVKYDKVVYNDGRIWVQTPPLGWVSVGSYDKTTLRRTEKFANFR